MDVDPGCNYMEKTGGGFQWYMMEGEDFLQISVSISKKNKMEIQYHLMVNQLLSD